MFVCIFAQLTLNKASPAHHFSVCQHPSSPAPSSPLRCGGEERSWLPWSTAPMAVCLARCSLLLPRLLRLWGLETPRLPANRHCPAKGLLCTAQALEAEHYGHPPQARNHPPPLHSTGHKGQQPTEAVVKFSTKFSSESGAREATQSQRKNDICPIVTPPALLQHQGSGVPTKYIYKGTTYFHSRNTNWDMVQKSSYERVPLATPRASVEKASQSKIWKCQTTCLRYNTAIYWKQGKNQPCIQALILAYKSL